jgi:hypothetical protein
VTPTATSHSPLTARATLADLIRHAQRASGAVSALHQRRALERLRDDFAGRVGCGLHRALAGAGWTVEARADGTGWFSEHAPACPWCVPACVEMRVDAAHMLTPARVEVRHAEGLRGGLVIDVSCGGVSKRDWCPLAELGSGLLRGLGWVYATAGMDPPEIELRDDEPR